VALSGDGGDELFGGYPRYFWAGRIESLRKRLSLSGARRLGRVLEHIPELLWDSVVARCGGKRLAGSEGLSARVKRLAGYLATPPERVYQQMTSAWCTPSLLLGHSPQHRLGPDVQRFPELCWAQQMMAVDQTNYLVDDILTKVDRASMAVSLEVRVPLLDHRLVEWSWRVPLAFKLAPRGDRGKLLMRAVLYRHVPRDLIERPKAGFSMPMGLWLRNELRPWAEELLSPAAMKNDGVLDPAIVQQIWQEHLNGQNRLPQLWTVLMFRQWLARWRQ
jgi:asparagine synthase (glutamine-hydrolysing)